MVDYKAYKEVAEGLLTAMDVEDLNVSAKERQTLQGFYEKCSKEFWRLDDSHPKEIGYFSLKETEIEYVTESGKTYVADHCALEEEQVRVLELVRINHPNKTLLRPVQENLLDCMDQDEILYHANEDELTDVFPIMAEHEDEPGKVGKIKTVVMVEQGCQTEPIPSEKNSIKPVLLTKNKVVTPYKVNNNQNNAQNRSDVSIREELREIREQLKVALIAPMQNKHKMLSAYNNAKEILEFVNGVFKRLKMVEKGVEKSKREFEIAETVATSLVKEASKSAKEELEKIQQRTRAQTNNFELALKGMETSLKRCSENDNDSDFQRGAYGRKLQRTALAAKVAGPRDRCYNCDDRGHWANECTRTDGLKLCFNCEKFVDSDHIKYNCRLKRDGNHEIGRELERCGPSRDRGFFQRGRGVFRGGRGGTSTRGGAEGGKRKSEALEIKGSNNKRGRIGFCSKRWSNFQYQSNSQSRGGFKNGNSTS